MIQRYILSLFCILLLSVLAYIPITTAQVIINEDLTGIWKGQDAGIYYVRHFGDNIMWVGLSPDDGKTWANIFVGKYNGDIISGTWADVPRGKVGGLGTLTLKVSQEDGFIIFSKIGSTGSGFSTSTWDKPSCPSILEAFRRCDHWDRNLPGERAPPGGPPLQPPPNLR